MTISNWKNSIGNGFVCLRCGGVFSNFGDFKEGYCATCYDNKKNTEPTYDEKYEEWERRVFDLYEEE